MEYKKLILALLFTLTIFPFALAINVSGCQPLNSAGDYYLTNNINIVQPTTPEGFVCFPITANNVNLYGEGFTVDYSSLSYAVSPITVDANDVLIDNLNFTGEWGNIDLNNSSRVTISNNTFSFLPTYFLMSSGLSFDDVIENNTFGSGGGIDFGNLEGVTIASNTFNSGIFYCLTAFDREFSSAPSIYNNIYNYCQFGIRLSNVSNINFDDETINYPNVGVSLGDSPPTNESNIAFNHLILNTAGTWIQNMGGDAIGVTFDNTTFETEHGSIAFNHAGLSNTFTGNVTINGNDMVITNNNIDVNDVDVPELYGMGGLLTFYDVFNVAQPYQALLDGDICPSGAGLPNCSIPVDLGSDDYDFYINQLASQYSLLTNCDTSNVFTPIKNISSFSTQSFLTNFNIQSNANDIEFKVTSPNCVGALGYKFENADLSKNQYFIYTSSDGISWTFDDTLTFGGNYGNPLQKIWQYNTDKYSYFFQEQLADDEIKYYKLTYKEIPFASIYLKGNIEWSTSPNPTLFNEWDTKHAYDVFNDSSYTNLELLSLDRFSELTGGMANKGYELQFTAFADSPATLKVGYRVGSTDTTTNINITTTKIRYSVPINTTDFTAQLLIKTISSEENVIYLSDYALVPRSYFASRLELFNADGSELKTILRENTVYQYLQEGVPFKFKALAFDKDLDLKKLRIDAMIGSEIVKTYFFDLPQNPQHLKNVISWNNLIDGVIDYNGSSMNNILTLLNPIRSLTIKATLINNADENVAEEYKTINLLQYPYFPNDLPFKMSLLTKKVGESPSFLFYMQPKQPEQILGFKFIVYDLDHNKQFPNYSKMISLNELGCENNYFCQKQLVLNEYQFEDERDYMVGLVAILKTEAQTYSNFLTQHFEIAHVSFTDFTTARLLQVFERRNHQYTNSEEVPLVLQIKDSAFSNMKNEFSVYLKIDVADGVGYTTLNQQYYPSKFIYSEVEGFNYWYFNDILFDDSGNLLTDGSHLRFKAYVVPLKQTRPTDFESVVFGLTDKCAVYPSDTNSFWEGVLDFLGLDIDTIKLGVDVFAGCTTKAPEVVGGEGIGADLIDINTSYVPKATQNQSVICVNKNGIVNPQLGDSLFCAIIYKKSEEQIDNFKFTIGNNNSDYSISDSTKQYFQFSIPQEEIMFNDVLMLKSALQTEFNTDKINSVGQVIGAGLSKIIGGYQNVADFGQILTDYGVIKNVGFDINLDGQLDPNIVHGIFFVKIDKLKVINVNDYLKDYPELNSVPATNFLEWAQNQNIFLPKKQTTITVFSTNLKPFMIQNIDSPLVIRENETKRRTSTPDENGLQYSTPPADLKITIISDMQSANQTKTQRSIFNIFLTYFVPSTFSFNEFFSGIGDFMTNPVQAIGDFAINNWFLLIILAGIIFIGSVVYANMKVGGGDTNIHNYLGRR